MNIKFVALVNGQGLVTEVLESEDGNYLLDIIISEDDFNRFKRDFELNLEEFFMK